MMMMRLGKGRKNTSKQQQQPATRTGKTVRRTDYRNHRLVRFQIPIPRLVGGETFFANGV